MPEALGTPLATATKPEAPLTPNAPGFLATTTGMMAAAVTAEVSDSLRQAFAACAEAWLQDVQLLVNAEVERRRAEVLQEVKQRRQHLEVEWTKLLQERESLAQENAALTVREEAFEREKRLLQGKHHPSDVIDLNVGGEVFCSVRRSTLCLEEDSALGSMFSGRWDESLERDGSGRVFVDFPPDIFMPLVDYLRQKRVEDPNKPAEPPIVALERSVQFKRMLSYYGLVDTVWRRPEGKWEPAWGQIQIGEDGRSISTSVQSDPYHAAALNTMRLKPSDGPQWKISISKSRADAPWYYDSVAFGLVRSDWQNRPSDSSNPQARDLTMNLRGNMGWGLSSIDSTDLGGLFSAERSTIHVDMRLRNRQLVMAFDGKEFASGRQRLEERLPYEDNNQLHWCLLVAVTYPWIRVALVTS